MQYLVEKIGGQHATLPQGAMPWQPINLDQMLQMSLADLLKDLDAKEAENTKLRAVGHSTPPKARDKRHANS